MASVNPHKEFGGGAMQFGRDEGLSLMLRIDDPTIDALVAQDSLLNDAPAMGMV